MGSGVRPRVWLLFGLAVAAGCSAEDEPKAPKLNPQPEIPVRPDAQYSSGVGREGAGGAPSSRAPLERQARPGHLADPRAVAPGTALPDGEGSAGAPSEDPAEPANP